MWRNKIRSHISRNVRLSYVLGILLLTLAFVRGKPNLYVVVQRNLQPGLTYTQVAQVMSDSPYHQLVNLLIIFSQIFVSFISRSIWAQLLSMAPHIYNYFSWCIWREIFVRTSQYMSNVTCTMIFLNFDVTLLCNNNIMLLVIDYKQKS